VVIVVLPPKGGSYCVQTASAFRRKMQIVDYNRSVIAFRSVISVDPDST
jgi:hypothetical protein